MQPKRKIIQLDEKYIALGVYGGYTLYIALCDDGTRWKRRINEDWSYIEKLPPIPQDSVRELQS